MKKLSRMLALGLALALTMGMTALAEESPDEDSVGGITTQYETKFYDSKTQASYAKKAEEEKKNVGTVTLHAGSSNVTLSIQAVAPETLLEAENVGLNKIQSAINSGKIDVGIAATDVQVKGTTAALFVQDMPFPAPTLITFNISGVKTGNTYVFLHLNHAGEWEVIPATVTANGQLTGAFTELSPLVVVELSKKGSATTSPKTGGAFPVAGALAVICAAGGLACAAKSRGRKQ